MTPAAEVAASLVVDFLLARASRLREEAAEARALAGDAAAFAASARGVDRDDARRLAHELGDLADLADAAAVALEAAAARLVPAR